jgi:hypothetical protein
MLEAKDRVGLLAYLTVTVSNSERSANRLYYLC